MALFTISLKNNSEKSVERIVKQFKESGLFFNWMFFSADMDKDPYTLIVTCEDETPKRDIRKDIPNIMNKLYKIRGVTYVQHYPINVGRLVEGIEVGYIPGR